MDAVGSARTQFSDSAASAQERVQSAQADLESSIERNPMTAVFVALGIGFVIGLMTRSR
jgi:ElaB/YqjD/DUF883 family membrane-anchored ribosome-binding protein